MILFSFPISSQILVHEPDVVFIIIILTVNSLLWLVLSIDSVRQKLPKIYLITRSWWWMLVLLFGSYLMSQYQNSIGDYPYWWVMDGLFILIGLRGGYEIARLGSVNSKSKLLKKLSMQDPSMTVDNLIANTIAQVKSPLSKFGWLDIVFALTLVSLVVSLISLHHLTLSRQMHGVLLFVFFASQFNDIAQYLCGRMFGGRLFKRKLAPNLSPNKTIEGALFGTVLSALLATLLGVWLTPFSILMTFCFAYLLAVLGVLGDLLESAFKRRHGIKDLGTMLAGHGGILDRVDSLLIGVPIFTMIYWILY